MQLVDPGFVDQSQDKPFALRYLVRPKPLDSQLWHGYDSSVSLRVDD
jgi:hypothetical protein